MPILEAGKRVLSPPPGCGNDLSGWTDEDLLLTFYHYLIKYSPFDAVDIKRIPIFAGSFGDILISKLKTGDLNL